MKKLFIIIALLWSQINLAQTDLGTYFTYQGELVVNGQSITGNYDFSVNLYNMPTAGTNVGGQFFGNVPVINGLFTLTIDIGDATFAGDERWLELSIRTVNGPTFTDLLPRQLISNAPFAIHSQFVGTDGVDSFAIKNGSVTTAKIADAAVTSNKIANAAVGSTQLAANSVNSTHIVDLSIEAIKLADAAVTSGKIANAAVGSTQLAANSVDSTHIVDLSVATADLKNDSVTTAKIVDGTINENDLANNSVFSVNISDGEVKGIDVDSTQVQLRVAQTCAAGSSIRAIAENGEVMCETDDVGTPFAGWGLIGNAGTNSATDFIGTTDNTDVIFKVNNLQGMKLMYSSANSIIAPNFIVGTSSNTISENINQISPSGSTIIGGSSNSIKSSDSMVAGRSNAINSLSGDSTITGGVFNVINASQSTIGGGNTNKIDANGLASFIGGGTDNTINSFFSVIPGGSQNSTTGNYSFAHGFGSKANHSGSWVWNDSSDNNSLNSLATTAENQFLIRAVGGVGIGTNAPASPLHIKGQGTSTGSTSGSNEVVMTIEPKQSTDGVAAVINKLDATKESAMIFSTLNQPEFDIRTVIGDALEINSYNFGVPNLVMRINDKASLDRIDFNTNLEPNIAGVYNFGSSTFRWKTLFSVNALDSSSDRRLKKNINDLDYGLAEVLAMRPVSYKWRKGETEKIHLGLIAQEVETLVPEVVSKSADKTQMRSMRYGELIPVLIKATQEQQTLIEQQAQQIKDLKSLVNDLLSNKKTNK